MIQNNLKKIKNGLPKHVTLVAVSKTKPISDIQEAYNAGQRIFGENKVQEMVTKYEALPKDIQWHMIGHVQRNKIKYMAHFVDLIHGVDNLKTLIEINKQAQKHNRVISCLLQVKIAKEETKFGIPFDEIDSILTSNIYKTLQHIKIVGFMGMATFTNNKEQVSKEFEKLNHFFEQQKIKKPELSILSMGMSNDFTLAIKKGSNMVRIGSSIFGVRNYIA
jgi:pyridoxal phosphate enzyme (YggS family)